MKTLIQRIFGRTEKKPEVETILSAEKTEEKTKMKYTNPETLMECIRRYGVIINYHKENPSRVEPNRNQLYEIQKGLLQLAPTYLSLQFGREVYLELKKLMDTNQENLAKLLQQNAIQKEL